MRFLFDMIPSPVGRRCRSNDWYQVAWNMSLFWFVLVFGVLLYAVSYRFGALLFQKILSAREREVLALPNRITSKIYVPMFGARASLALLHWVAAVGVPVALSVTLSLRLPR